MPITYIGGGHRLDVSGVDFNKRTASGLGMPGADFPVFLVAASLQESD